MNCLHTVIVGLGLEPDSADRLARQAMLRGEGPTPVTVSDRVPCNLRRIALDERFASGGTG
ncbi:hypothetical protein AQJ66_29740 [Streptomyces bungoensis]|uniref:Uncharacterized protein n=1 Tax=Streptomyces bungoensis TaxID=285568 RepID=A0A101SRV8_9ACTN|nr:hypothetical protein AQJ66_29740 [Streptomyces bungoensis]